MNSWIRCKLAKPLLPDECTEVGCKNQAVAGGKCGSHRANAQCTEVGCKNQAHTGGKCRGHRANVAATKKRKADIISDTLVESASQQQRVAHQDTSLQHFLEAAVAKGELIQLVTATQTSSMVTMETIGRSMVAMQKKIATMQQQLKESNEQTKIHIHDAAAKRAKLTPKKRWIQQASEASDEIEVIDV